MNNPNISISLTPRVLDQTRQETLLWQEKNSETGGIWLLQETTPGQFTAKDYIGPGPNAQRTTASFQPDVAYQNAEICKRRTENPSASIIAPWHSHPGSFGVPSGTDRQAAMEALATWDLHKPELLIAIAIAPKGDFSLRTFHITQSSGRFAEVPWHASEEAAAPSEQRNTFWLDLESARVYLSELMSQAEACGYTSNAERTLDEIRIVFTHPNLKRPVPLSFPRAFPFEPSWLQLPAGRQRLATDRNSAARLLRSELRRLTRSSQAWIT